MHPKESRESNRPKGGLFSKAKMAEIRNDEEDISQLWLWVRHEDNLLASRVSFFLLAQSILIAVAASLVNTLTGLSHPAAASLRREVFGLAIAIDIAGLTLTLVFWYVFRLNFLSIGTAMDELNSIVNRLQVDNFRARIVARRNQRRNESWFSKCFSVEKG